MGAVLAPDHERGVRGKRSRALADAVSGAYFRNFPEVRFLDEHDGGRETFALLSPFVAYSALLGRDVTVPRGFVSDGESVPRVVLGMTGLASIRAGIVHDFLYRGHLNLPEANVTKEQADDVYLEMMLAAGVDEVHARMRYTAVARLGQGAWDTAPGRLKVMAL